jgi:Aspartyl protease
MRCEAAHSESKTKDGDDLALMLCHESRVLRVRCVRSETCEEVMKYYVTFFAVVCAFVAPMVAGASSGETPDSAADRLFNAGDFSAAATAYAAVLGANPNDAQATRRLGALRLYENDLGAAATLLNKAATLDPSSAAVTSLLAEVKRRQAEAAKRIAVSGDEVAVPFVVTDPLPVVHVRLNATEDATFIIDTGAPDIVLSDTLAKRLGVKAEAAGMGTFAGGKQAAFSKANVQSIALGSATAYDVSATILPMPQIIPQVQVDGIVGTGLLERFLATLDYPKRQLTLRPRNIGVSAAFEAAATVDQAVSVPCWLVGDHFVFATAQVNSALPGLFLFDSGLAGGGIMPSKTLIDAAHITLDEAHASTGMGGGGPVRAVPFVASSVAVGSAVQRNVPGLYTPEGSPLGIFPFTVQGVISHDFLKHYAYTVDFDAMKIVLSRSSP